MHAAVLTNSPLALRAFIVGASCLLTLVATVPYMIDIARGRTKPRVVTWFTWALILIIGAVAAFSDHQMATGIFMLVTGLEAALIVILSFKHGDAHFEKLDRNCLIALTICAELWVFVRSPEITIAMTVLIDFIGAIPTLKHAWLRPHEETLITYVLFSTSSFLILLTTNFRVFTAVAYPLYVFVADFMIMALIMVSPYRRAVHKLG